MVAAVAAVTMKAAALVAAVAVAAVKVRANVMSVFTRLDS